MLHWLKRYVETGRVFADSDVSGSQKLATLLRDYPPATPPHLGTNGALPNSIAPKLTLAQFHENLAWQIESAPGRLATLQTLFGMFDVSVTEAYVEETRAGFIAALDRFLVEQMPATYTVELADRADWEASDRAGPHIVHSLIADLAWLEGDILIRARPGSFWGLNVNPGDRQMIMYRRPCVLGLSDGLFPGTHNIYHLEAEWFSIYRRMNEIYPGRFGYGIGSVLLRRIARDVVEDDLPQRRATGWLAKSV